MQRFLPWLAMGLMLMANVFFLPNSEVHATQASGCVSILPESWCVKDSDSGIVEIVRFAVRFLTGGVVIVGTIGIIWCGYLILTARDNEEQVAKARGRMIDVIIGIIAFGILGFLVDLFLPGADTSGVMVIVNNIRNY